MKNKSLRVNSRKLAVRVKHRLDFTIQRDPIMRILSRVWKTITEALSRGEKVDLYQFGVFKVVIYPPRRMTVQNRFKHTATEYDIPSRGIVKFHAARKLKEKILRSK